MIVGRDLAACGPDPGDDRLGSHVMGRLRDDR
jgi:hypothetical protein